MLLGWMLLYMELVSHGHVLFVSFILFLYFMLKRLVSCASSLWSIYFSALLSLPNPSPLCFQNSLSSHTGAFETRGSLRILSEIFVKEKKESHCAKLVRRLLYLAQLFILCCLSCVVFHV